MGTKKYFKMMADYHLWAYQRLQQSLEPLSDDEYYRECGLFFKSVHGTLNHLLLGDRVWHGRLVAELFPISGLDQELLSSRHELSETMLAQSRCWIDYVEQLPEACYHDPLTYRSSGGHAYCLPIEQLLGHVFNHGTHHRGQISTVITQLGYPCPEMDLVYFQLGM